MGAHAVERRLLFLVLALTLPFPMWIAFDAFVPPMRYAILLAVSASVALSEGASGPVPGILLLFAVHAVVYGLAAWLVAWIASRALTPLSPAARRMVVWALCAALLLAALAFQPYRTPFGRAPVGNLLAVLS